MPDLVAGRQHDGLVGNGQGDPLRAGERAQGSRVPRLDRAKTLSVVFKAHQVNASSKRTLKEDLHRDRPAPDDVDMAIYSTSHVEVAVEPCSLDRQDNGQERAPSLDRSSKNMPVVDFEVSRFDGEFNLRGRDDLACDSPKG